MDLLLPIPLAVFLCLAAVQALRRHWRNALTAALAAGLVLAIMAGMAQAHVNAMLRAGMRLQEKQISKLKHQLDSGGRDDRPGPAAKGDEPAD